MDKQDKISVYAVVYIILATVFSLITIAIVHNTEIVKEEVPCEDRRGRTMIDQMCIKEEMPWQTSIYLALYIMTILVLAMLAIWYRPCLQ